MPNRGLHRLHPRNTPHTDGAEPLDRLPFHFGLSDRLQLLDCGLQAQCRLPRHDRPQGILVLGDRLGTLTLGQRRSRQSLELVVGDLRRLAQLPRR